MHDLLDETTVSIFVDWVYTQRLPQTELEWCNGKHEDHRLRMKSNAQLARTKALILDDRIVSPLFYRTVRDSLIEHIVESGAYCGASIHAFAHLPKAHAILDLFVEVQCRGFDDPYDTAGNSELELRASLPHDFLVRVMFRYSRSDEEELPLDDIDRCDYHGHADEEEKKQYQTEVNRD